MADVRELVLARLVEIAEGVAGVVTARRNIKRPADDRLPAIVVLDADEAAEETDPGGHPHRGPRRIAMSPETYILTAGKPEEVGPAINALRALWVKAVLTDATLASIIGTNGEIRYEGCATGLSWGREMIGDMGVSFSFHYVLQPAQL